MVDQHIQKLRLPDLSLAEFYDLERELDAHQLSVEQRRAAGSKFGALDPVTAVVIVTTLSLKVLATWLLRNKSSQTIAQKVEIEYADGRRETREICITTTSETTDNDVVREIAKALSVPFDLTKED